MAWRVNVCAEVQGGARGVEHVGLFRALDQEGDEECAEHEHVAEQEHPGAAFAGDPAGGMGCGDGVRCHAAASAACSALIDFSITAVVENSQITSTRPGM